MFILYIHSLNTTVQVVNISETTFNTFIKLYKVNVIVPPADFVPINQVYDATIEVAVALYFLPLRSIMAGYDVKPRIRTNQESL